MARTEISKESLLGLGEVYFRGTVVLYCQLKLRECSARPETQEGRATSCVPCQSVNTIGVRLRKLPTDRGQQLRGLPEASGPLPAS